MNVEKAREIGFCFGVRKAIDLVEKAAAESGRLETLGAIVHNHGVIEELEKRGIRVITNLAGATGTSVAISSHGVGPAVFKEIQERGLKAVDATCPRVRHAQNVAKEFAERGCYVVVFGDASHPEVKGILAWAGENSVAATDAATLPAAALASKDVGILSQTTQNTATYIAFASKLMAARSPSFRETSIINTICLATAKRQEAAAALARKHDLIIVVGGRTSANTKRLADACQAAGVETHLVETADEIQPAWLKGHRSAGVTAGTSTPDKAIEAVVERLRKLG